MGNEIDSSRSKEYAPVRKYDSREDTILKEVRDRSTAVEEHLEFERVGEARQRLPVRAECVLLRDVTVPARQRAALVEELKQREIHVGLDIDIKGTDAGKRSGIGERELALRRLGGWTAGANTAAPAANVPTTVMSRRFRDWFGPHDVHVYRFGL